MSVFEEIEEIRQQEERIEATRRQKAGKAPEPQATPPVEGEDDSEPSLATLLETASDCVRERGPIPKLEDVDRFYFARALLATHAALVAERERIDVYEEEVAHQKAVVQAERARATAAEADAARLRDALEKASLMDDTDENGNPTGEVACCMCHQSAWTREAIPHTCALSSTPSRALSPAPETTPQGSGDDR